MVNKSVLILSLISLCGCHFHWAVRVSGYGMQEGTFTVFTCMHGRPLVVSTDYAFLEWLHKVIIIITPRSSTVYKNKPPLHARSRTDVFKYRLRSCLRHSDITIIQQKTAARPRAP